MQKFIILIVSALFVFCTSIVYAAPVGNPAEPALLHGKYPIKATGIVTAVLKRELDENETQIDKIMEYTGKLAVNFKKKVEIYGILGAVDDGELRDDKKIISSSTTDTELKPAFLYGGGATIMLFDTPLMGGVLRIGMDGKYQRFEADIDNLIKDSADQPFTSDEVTSQEWQVAVGLSYQYDRFVPYVGGKYSDVEIKEKVTISGTQYDNKLNSDHMFGVFAGCDFIFTDNVKLNVEGRFIDETAASISGTIMF